MAGSGGSASSYPELLPAIRTDKEWGGEMTDETHLYDQVMASLQAIEQDEENPPTRAEVLKMAHIKALIMIGQSIGETTFR
jgi:hypothetical protein